MGHYRELLVRNSTHSSHPFASPNKGLGGDQHSGDSVLFDFDAVEQTARTARPSIAVGQDDHITACGILLLPFLPLMVLAGTVRSSHNFLELELLA